VRDLSHTTHGHLKSERTNGRVHPANLVLRDEAIPAFSDLLGASVPASLIAACGRKSLTEVAPAQVTWWPGKSLTVRFRAVVDGSRTDLVAIAGDIPPEVTVVAMGPAHVGVWRLPHDPFLPGLASALDASAVAPVLGEPAASTRLVAYRPGRRAVVAVTGVSGRQAYLKLVRPSDVEEVHRTHKLLSGCLPVPTSLGFDPDLGILALQRLPGITLRETLLRNRPPPSPATAFALLAALPTPNAARVTASALDNLPRLGALLARLLPSRRGQIRALIDQLGPDQAPADIPVHGDFYEAQLLVHKSSICGLLDVDTFGWGRPADDAATMLGHLDVLDKPGARAWARGLLRLADATLDPVDLRRRVAAEVLALATGPFRVQRANWPAAVGRRLDVALRWLASAERVDERPLTSGSDPSHVRTAC